MIPRRLLARLTPGGRAQRPELVAVTSDTTWQVPAGLPFTASLVDPAGLTATLGARIETPVARAIVDNWKVATLTGGLYTVTMDAPATPGAYELVWRTGDPDPPSFEGFVPLIVVANAGFAATPPVDYPAVDEGEVRPSVDEVAKLLQTRTVDEGGAEQGTFNDITRPTADQAEQVIDQAVDDTLSELQPQFDPRHYRQCKRVITLECALLIEGSYYREQADDKVVTLYQNLHDSALAGLQNRIQQDLDQQNLIGGLEPGAHRHHRPRYLV